EQELHLPPRRTGAAQQRYQLVQNQIRLLGIQEPTGEQERTGAVAQQRKAPLIRLRLGGSFGQRRAAARLEDLVSAHEDRLGKVQRRLVRRRDGGDGGAALQLAIGETAHLVAEHQRACPGLREEPRRGLLRGESAGYRAARRHLHVEAVTLRLVERPHHPHAL